MARTPARRHLQDVEPKSALSIRPLGDQSTRLSRAYPESGALVLVSGIAIELLQ
jgi:hypothetical protein